MNSDALMSTKKKCHSWIQESSFDMSLSYDNSKRRVIKELMRAHDSRHIEATAAHR